jgi:tRNA A58 N-methylase Trm61
MKRLIALALSLVAAGTVVIAHGGNEHVRGVVTQISAQSITVQTARTTTKTLTLGDKTTYKRGDKTAHLTDLKVGDRVVVDVQEKTTRALQIQIGASTTASAHKP